MQLRVPITVYRKRSGSGKLLTNMVLHNQMLSGYGKFSLLDLPCLEQLLTWLQILDYHNFCTMKDERLSINALASINCLRHRNVFQNVVNFFSKMVNHFWPNISKFCIFCTIRFCSTFSRMWSKDLSNNAWRDFQLSTLSASVIVT